MRWDLILTSYTINSLPVCCSTNKLLKTWLGKAKYFCICYNSKMKQKPATKIQGRVFLWHWRPHAKIQALSRKFFFSPKSSLSMVLHSRLQFLHYVLQFVFFCFFLHTYVPSKLQCRTGFHLASSILLLLYLAAMWHSVSYFLFTNSLKVEKKGRLLFLQQFHKCSLPKTIK